MTDLLIRPMQPSELAYVKATWLKHYKENSEFAKPIRDSIFFPAHSQIVDNILKRHSTGVLICSHHDEPDIILGFLVYELERSPTIHYAYVIARARMMRLASEMLRAAEIGTDFTFTHRTQDAKAIQLKYSGMTYDPYRL